MLSLFFKESGALFFLILPAYVFLFDRPRLKSAFTSSAVAAGGYLAIRLYFKGFGNMVATGLPITQADLATRLLTFPKSAFYYLKTFFWPADLALNQNWLVKEVSFQEVLAPLVAVLLALGILMWIVRRSEPKTRPVLIFLFGILLLNTGLHSNILVPLDATIAERWFYLGSFALIGFIFVALSDLVTLKPSLNRVLIPVLSLILVASAWRSYERTLDWTSPRTLFEKEIKTNPEDFAAANALGLEYYRIGRFDLAEQYFRKSIQNAPQLWVNWNNLGAIEEVKGNLKVAEQYYAQSINNGQYPKAIFNYARILKIQNRDEELAKFLKEALLVLPKNPFLLELQNSIPQK